MQTQSMPLPHLLGISIMSFVQYCYVIMFFAHLRHELILCRFTLKPNILFSERTSIMIAKIWVKNLFEMEFHKNSLTYVFCKISINIIKYPGDLKSPFISASLRDSIRTNGTSQS